MGYQNQQQTPVVRAYRKPGRGSMSGHDNLDERTARQLKRHHDLMAQYDQIAPDLVGRVAFEVLPGQGSVHDPFMFRPVHKELPRFRGRPVFVCLHAAEADKLIISEVESYPANGRLKYSISRYFDFGLPPTRDAEFPRLDGTINHVLLTAGNNLLQELINTADTPIDELQPPELPRLLIMLDKVRIDEAKLEKLAAAIEPPELRAVYSSKRRESAEVMSLGELFGDAAVLRDVEIAAGLRQQRAYEDYTGLLGAPEMNPARKVFFAHNPARSILRDMGLAEDWAAVADEETVEAILAQMRESLPLPEMATDADLLDALSSPDEPVNLSVSIDNVPSAVVIRAMRAAIPAGKALLKHVTDEELLAAARRPYEPLIVHAYSRIQVCAAANLIRLPTYAAGSFFPDNAATPAAEPGRPAILSRDQE